MRYNKQQNKGTITRRSFLLGGFKATLVAGLLGRMFYLQVLNHNEYAKLSEKNHIKTIYLRPVRGIITDRNNQELATNQRSYQLEFEKLVNESQNLQSISSVISRILKYSNEEEQELYINLSELKDNEEIVIEPNVSWSELMELELNLYDLKGINLGMSYERKYPFGELFSHITGYLGSSSEKGTLKQMTFLKIGRNGIEKTQEENLRGIAGNKRIEVNAKGEIIQEISSVSASPGKDIKLALDTELQSKATQLLEGNNGVVLLAKLNTGEILTSVSLPNFNPNLFGKKVPQKEWDKLINSNDLPLINRVVALTYPPGSAFKINVAIAALKNKFDPETRFFCPGHYVLGERKFHCWNKHGHGSLNLFQAIAGSCNVYFWNIAKIVGIQKIADCAKEMGFSKKILDNFLPREQQGIMPDPSWKKNNFSQNWSMADTFNSAIGQGYVEATPIQMLTMIMRIATGKKILPSYLYNSENNNSWESLGIDEELKLVKKGMEMTTSWNQGTGFLNRINIAGMEMAGKTGTCQVISKRYAEEDLSSYSVTKRLRNHGVFMAYAPIHQPKYGFFSIIEHGGTPTLAVKIARELLTQVQIKNI